MHKQILKRNGLYDYILEIYIVSNTYPSEIWTEILDNDTY